MMGQSPKGAALGWEAALLWPQFLTNLLLALALLAIATGLYNLIDSRGDVSLKRCLWPLSLLLGLLAGLFLVNLSNLWGTYYRLETGLMLLSAAAALVAAVACWRSAPPAPDSPRPQRSDSRPPEREADLHIRSDELARRVDEQARALERARADLEQYNYMVSHDLQEPLRMVMGFTQLLQKRYGEQLDAEGREFVALTVQSAARLSEMLGDLLKLSRIDRERIEPRTVDLQEALDSALAQLEPKLEAAQAELNIAALPKVAGNRQLLTQALQLLLDNAVKFRGALPLRIAITAEPQQGKWRITLRDNGIGLDPAFAERIFQPFQRLHTAEEYPGTGIGLALVRHIVERHGGEVGVRSEPGEGAQFWFTLPAAAVETGRRDPL